MNNMCQGYNIQKIIPFLPSSSFKWRVTVSGELMFLESYGNCDVTNILLSVYDVTKQFLITISDKHCNSPAVNI